MREYFPNFVELLQIFLERLDGIVLWEIVLIKLLNDDKNKQLEHDVGADNDEAVEVEVGKPAAARLILNTAVRFSSRAIEHHAIPILTCHHCNQLYEWAVEIPEIFVVWNHVARCDVTEQLNCKNCEHEKNDEEEQYDIGQLGNWENDCLDDCLQAFKAAGKLEQSGHSQDSEYSCERWHECNTLEGSAAHNFKRNIKDWSNYNKEVEFVPAVFEITWPKSN